MSPKPAGSTLTLPQGSTSPAGPARPAAYPEPAAPAAPRRPAKILPLATSRLPTEAARRQDIAKGPQQPPGEQQAIATTTPGARPSGGLAPPHRAVRAAAGLAGLPGSPVSARPRACKFASSAVERGTHLPAEFFRSLPSSPELLTPAFRIKKEA